jgi:UDP-N-acetylmuramate dehydrogenase
VVGGGFNLLVRDGGWRGVVAKLTGLRELALRDDGSVFAEAGVTHATLARFCADHGRSGLEFAVGIPGTVGGWIAMNAGVHAREMKDVVLEVELYDPATGALETRARDALGFRYRAAALPPGGVVVSARFQTAKGTKAAIRAEQKKLLAQRRATQPVDQPSCGSVFKNPPGDYAGRLIEAAGLKGSEVGGARISELHANFIVTRADARAADVLALIARARDAVRERFGVELEPEVRVLGEDA